MAKSFDITKMVTGISNENSDEAFKILEIDITKIEPNENNFYNTEEIENLKASIMAVGLQHNLVVSKKDENGKYKIISGHRRFKAINELIADGELDIKTLPCKIDNKSELEQRLALIVSNSTSREISPAEKMKQVEELKAIANELKSNPDTKFKGKVRDFIADTLNMSTSEVARYEAISSNLTDEIKEEFTKDIISTDTAYAISKLGKEKQEEVIEVIEEAKAENKKITTKDVKEIATGYTVTMNGENLTTMADILTTEETREKAKADNIKAEIKDTTDILQKENKQTKAINSDDWKFENQIDIDDVVDENEKELKNTTHKIYVLSDDFENISNGIKTFEIMPKGKCKIGDIIEIQHKEKMKRTYVKVLYIAFESYFNNDYEIVSISLQI